MGTLLEKPGRGGRSSVYSVFLYPLHNAHQSLPFSTTPIIRSDVRNHFGHSLLFHPLLNQRLPCEGTRVAYRRSIKAATRSRRRRGAPPKRVAVRQGELRSRQRRGGEEGGRVYPRYQAVGTLVEDGRSPKRGGLKMDREEANAPITPSLTLPLEEEKELRQPFSSNISIRFPELSRMNTPYVPSTSATMAISTPMVSRSFAAFRASLTLREKCLWPWVNRSRFG